MNIFYLHNNPKEAAKMHCNKHVVKMILESAQMLSTAHHLLGNDSEYLLKSTHQNHPSTAWARTNVKNYKWLSELAIELCNEYTFRYEKIHKLQLTISWLKENIPKNIPDGEFTQPSIAMNEIYKEMFKPFLNDHIKAYRLYYIFDKWRMLNYKKREEPDWVTKSKRFIKDNNFVSLQKV